MKGLVDDDELLGPDTGLVERAVRASPVIGGGQHDENGLHGYVSLKGGTYDARRREVRIRDQMFWPPEISMRWAVIQRFSGPSKLATAGPMSSGTPTRPSAIIAAKASL